LYIFDILPLNPAVNTGFSSFFTPVFQGKLNRWFVAEMKRDFEMKRNKEPEGVIKK